MSEQQSQTTTATAVQPATKSACPHPEAVGKRWGDPISEERQAELQGYLDRWAAETDHGERRGPFDRATSNPSGVPLTGADVSWLAEQSGRNEFGWVPHLQLEGADLDGAHLEDAGLAYGHLEGAILMEARLEGANLICTHLEGAFLVRTHLEGASLIGALLEGAFLAQAHLEGTNLQLARLNSKTMLEAAHINTRTCLGDVRWGGIGTVDLTSLTWGDVSTLGDELGVGLRAKASEHEAVVRAYRQLAAHLRAQGMSEVADRFAYRAQVKQRGVLLRRFRIPQYLGSRFLDLISGYGYRPWRSFITYALVILGFAIAYFTLGGANGQPLSWNEAIVISMTAFHGRGFFSAVFQPGDVQAAVAAVEAFIGLLIEIVFIATFTNRFFAR